MGYRVKILVISKSFSSFCNMNKSKLSDEYTCTKVSNFSMNRTDGTELSCAEIKGS